MPKPCSGGNQPKGRAGKIGSCLPCSKRNGSQIKQGLKLLNNKEFNAKSQGNQAQQNSGNDFSRQGFFDQIGWKVQDQTHAKAE